MERPKKRAIPLAEDHTLDVGRGEDGRPLLLPTIAVIFKEQSADPKRQAKVAIGCIIRILKKEGTASADDIFALMTNEEAKDEIRVWCKGKNIKLKEEETEDEESKYQRAKKILDRDKELIEKLEPHLQQIDLARILAVKKYREADEETRQSLICGTYRLLGDVLGPRRHFKQDTQVITPLNLPDLPIEIFSDEIIRQILRESEREAVLPIFQRSAAAGFRYLAERRQSLTEPLLISFVEDLEEYFQKGLSDPEPGFRNKIAGSQKDLADPNEITYSDFPSPHQQLYGYRFKHKEIGPQDLLIGAVRTGKSKGSLYAHAAAGARSTIIVCPPGLRYNWEREIREAFEDPVEVIQIESTKQLKHLARHRLPRKENIRRQVILGYSLLSRLNVLESPLLFRQLIRNLGLDSLTADEVHLAKESKAECTKQLYLLSRAFSKETPRIAMTATGVVNTVEDLDAPVRILRPYDYENPGDFTRSARNDPHLVSALLYGKQLMTRWTAEAILGYRLPNTEYYTEPVPFSPFHQSVYELVYSDSTIEDTVKRGMLRQASLDPLLIRRHYHPDSLRKMINNLRRKQEAEKDERKRELIGERIKAYEERIAAVTGLSSRDQAMQDLAAAHDKFIEWQLTQQETVFDEDFLIKLGYEKLALWAFFNLPHSVDDLVKMSTDQFLSVDWTGKQGVYSSKYRRLKEKLDKLMASGKAKIAIFTGFYTTGVTSDLEDISEGDKQAFYSLHQFLCKWYGEDACLKIDGSVLIEAKKGEQSAREKVRRQWRLDPAKRIILLSSRSAQLGMDLTVPPTKENAVFEEVDIINLDQPDTAADKQQGHGRFQGPGQKIKNVVTEMLATNNEQPRNVRYGFIDYGIWQALEFKRLLSQMTLDAVPLTEEEEAFVKANLSSLTQIELYPTTPQAYLTQRFLVDIRGRGTQKNLEYLSRVGFEGLTNAEFFVTYYTQNEEMSLAGHNAKAVSTVIRKHQESLGRERFLIGSVGAGAGILQATLGQEIINIDIFFDILNFARHRLGNHGSFITGDGACLPIADESFDILDTSLALHWTSNDAICLKDGTVITERARFFRELNRVTKTGGRVVITLPWSYLTAAQFKRWSSCFAQFFGLELCEDVPSGLLKATDYRAEPISWIFNLQKVREPQLGFSVQDLRFDFEELVHIVSPKNGRGRRNGAVGIPQPILHSEFEIIQPDGSGSEEIVYRAPVVTSDGPNLQKVEEELLSQRDKDEKLHGSGEEILQKFGVEEYGFYRRMRRIAKSRWDLEAEKAEKLAVEAIVVWASSGSHRHNVGRILTELDIIMEDLYERDKQNES